jgi:hypothetical protein
MIRADFEMTFNFFEHCFFLDFHSQTRHFSTFNLKLCFSTHFRAIFAVISTHSFSEYPFFFFFLKKMIPEPFSKFGSFLPGFPVTIDNFPQNDARFSYENAPFGPCHFLTHAHSDHCSGLESGPRGVWVPVLGGFGGHFRDYRRILGRY